MKTVFKYLQNRGISFNNLVPRKKCCLVRPRYPPEADKWQFSVRAKHKLKSVDQTTFFNSALKDFSPFCQ